MRYLPIIPVLLDKVTCLTSALFLLPSFFFVYFLGGGVGLNRGRSALYILIFSVQRMTHTVPVVKNNQSQAFQLGGVE